MSELKAAMAQLIQGKFAALFAEASELGFAVSWDREGGFAVATDEGTVALVQALPAPAAAAPSVTVGEKRSLTKAGAPEVGDECPVCQKGTINRNGNCRVCRQREYAKNYAKTRAKK